MQNRENFLGRGQTPFPVGRGQPFPTPHPLGAYGASILAPTALDLGAFGASS